MAALTSLLFPQLSIFQAVIHLLCQVSARRQIWLPMPRASSSVHPFLARAQSPGSGGGRRPDGQRGLSPMPSCYRQPPLTSPAQFPGGWVLSSSVQSAGRIYSLSSHSEYCYLGWRQQAIFPKCHSIVFITDSPVEGRRMLPCYREGN